jgi:hypothetical protein
MFDRRSSDSHSPLVARFLERGGFGPKTALDDALATLVERTRRRRSANIEQRIHSLLRDRKVSGPEFVDLDCDGLIEPLGSNFADGFRIKLNKNTPTVRSRFTLAHEVCHTFFYELVPEIKFLPHSTDKEEERACNAVAAAILLPANSLERRVKGLSVSLESLETIAAEYQVSTATMVLRLRSLNLWRCELSQWRRMTDGRFALHAFYGGKRSNWEWQDATLLQRAWESGRSLFGQTFITCEDGAGVQRYRPVQYEISRHPNGVIALWGATTAIHDCCERLPLLTSSSQQKRARVPRRP